MRQDTALSGIAGVHHVASELSRRGLIALVTTRNTSAYDLIVATPDGRRHANVQVKSAMHAVTGFHMPPAEQVRTGDHDYYVCARWCEPSNRTKAKDKTARGYYDCFLLTGREARAEVLRNDAVMEALMKQPGCKRKGYFHAIVVGPKRNGEAAERWRKAWRDWKL